MRNKRKQFLTEPLETSVDKDLAAWVRERAERDDRSTAAVVRKALQVYRELEEARGVAV